MQILFQKVKDSMLKFKVKIKKFKSQKKEKYRIIETKGIFSQRLVIDF